MLYYIQARSARSTTKPDQFVPPATTVCMGISLVDWTACRYRQWNLASAGTMSGLFL